MQQFGVWMGGPERLKNSLEIEWYSQVLISGLRYPENLDNRTQFCPNIEF
jgi:hypothetical protein